MKFVSSSMMSNGRGIALAMIPLLFASYVAKAEAVLLMKLTFANDEMYNCSAVDGALIANAINADYYLGAPLKGDKAIKIIETKDTKATKPPKYNRKLRRNLHVMKRFTSSVKPSRSLQTSLDCKALCAGKVPPFCYVTRCTG
jgi:hypothetical protein